MDFFSHSEVPSLCLRDLERTRAFEAAIRRVVRPGDVVLDAGAGSGILSLFAASAGARKVYAVEVDAALCERLRENAARNGFGHVIEVLCDDVRLVRVPVTARPGDGGGGGRVDVVIAEMIETWLLDELQVPALNALREHGVTGTGTRFIPGRYDAMLEIGSVDFSAYGFEIPFPVHAWADLESDRGWQAVRFQSASPRLEVFKARFDTQIDESFDVVLEFTPTSSVDANAIRLSGLVHLDDACTLGPTVAFNGDKLLPIPSLRLVAGQRCGIRVAARRGGEGGLGRIIVERSDP
ncbi:MAG: 50S ribosomal protein L11 methyltransferase [Phycisphaerales bacterium]|nr:50S ribosomal protein L11 methyltransferase [Phycisphaerales bacterium]